MRSLFSLLAAVALLSLVPVRAWAADHGHCDEPAAAQESVPETAASPAAEWSAPAHPCTECPDDSCTSHRHCAVGTPPVIAEAAPIQVAPAPASAAGPVTTTGFAASFDPTPPTPPPDLRVL